MSVNRYQTEQSYIELRVSPGTTLDDLKAGIREFEVERSKWGRDTDDPPLTVEVDEGYIVFRFPTTYSATGGWPGD